MPRPLAPVTLAILSFGRDTAPSTIQDELAKQGYGHVDSKRIWAVRTRHAPTSVAARVAARSVDTLDTLDTHTLDVPVSQLRDAALRLGADHTAALLTELFASHGVTVRVAVVP